VDAPIAVGQWVDENERGRSGPNYRGLSGGALQKDLKPVQQVPQPIPMRGDIVDDMLKSMRLADEHRRGAQAKSGNGAALAHDLSLQLG